jgi:carboxyl-terminal processing protease
MNHETQWLIKVLEQAHFNKLKIKDLNTSVFINKYIKKLDKQKLYFTKDEVEGFHKQYGLTVTTHLQQGNLLPGFEIYNKYKTKAVSRLNWVLTELENDQNLFVDKNYTSNRDESDWVTSEKNLDFLWKDLIKSEFIREMIQQLDQNTTEINEGSQNFKKSLAESRDNLKKSYERWIKNIEEFEPSDVQEIYLTTLTHMFDPHTVFMNMKEKEKFDQAMNNEFVGIGARLQDEDGYCTIKELLPGGPAEASRELEPNDIILKVAQAEGEYIDVVDMKLTNIVDLIKGPKDTLVRLQIRPIKDPSSKKEVRIIRDKIKLTENLAKGYIKQIIINGKTSNVGVVELPSFYGSSGKGPKATDDVDELITKLKSYDIKGLILDLRRNGGGYLSEAVNLTGLFISRGPVVQVKYSDGKIRKKFDFNPKISWNGPLLTLVSRYSASASEIVAGALQDHDRAIIVGDESTHGKGTVQSMVQMNLPFNLLANRTGGKTSAAKITIQKYYLPSGNSTQITGVKSDISMPSINSLLPIGESDLENALPNDKITAVNFRKTNEQFSFNDDITSQLNDKADERRAESKSFKYLNENISFFKSKREQNEFSLNLNDRLKERIKEKRKSEQLKEEQDSFKEISYPSKKIQLSIVDEQILQSRKARGLDKNSTESSEEFEIPENFDLQLHESLNILTDYLEYSNASASTSRSIQTPQEI